MIVTYLVDVNPEHVIPAISIFYIIYFFTFVCPLHDNAPLIGNWLAVLTSLAQVKLNGNSTTISLPIGITLVGCKLKCISPVVLTVDGSNVITIPTNYAGDKVTAENESSAE